jgi:UDP-N-acetylmuramate--alanine ligase
LVKAGEWADAGKRVELFEALKKEIGLPLVLKVPHQSAPDNFSVIKEDNFEAFAEGLERGFSQRTIYKKAWLERSPEQQLTFIKNLTDIRKGTGLPVSTGNGTIIHHPEQLLQVIQRLFTQTDQEALTLFSTGSEPYLVAEAFTAGKAFRCLVIQAAEGQPLALFPTGLKEKTGIATNPVATINNPEQPDQAEIFLNLPPEKIQPIRQECQRLCKTLGLRVFAAVNGIITEAGEIIITDFDTSPELLPSSFVFRQAAQIGLNPCQFLTYIIRTSLAERLNSGSQFTHVVPLLHHLETAIKNQHTARQHKIKVGILMGANLTAPDSSFESGRYVYELLAASEKYQPIPGFRTMPAKQPRYYILPLAFLFMENAGEIKEKIIQTQPYQGQDSLLDQIRDEAESITATFAGNMLRQPQYINYEQLRNLVDIVLISLPGQEGTEGALQAEFEKLNLPYNGSGPACLQLAKNHSERNKILKQHGFTIPDELPTAQPDRYPEPLGNTRCLAVTSGLLTRYLPDSRPAYEIFEPTLIPTGSMELSAEESFLAQECMSMAPVGYAPDPQVNQFISERVKAALKKAAQVLNIEGYARLDASVSIIEPDEVEIQMTEINLLPDLAPGSCIIRQGTINGYKPYHIIDRILQFSLERHKLKE